MNQVFHVDAPFDKSKRALILYSIACGRRVTTSDGGEYNCWHIGTANDGPGINGGLFNPKESIGRVNTFLAESLDNAPARMQSAGHLNVRQRHGLPGVGWFAYCTDTDGSLVRAMQAVRYGFRPMNNRQYFTSNVQRNKLV